MTQRGELERRVERGELERGFRIRGRAGQIWAMGGLERKVSTLGPKYVHKFNINMLIPLLLSPISAL